MSGLYSNNKLESLKVAKYKGLRMVMKVVVKVVIKMKVVMEGGVEGSDEGGGECGGCKVVGCGWKLC